MANLVLLRHGQSEANEGERFAGWIDVPLTANGIQQARLAGAALAGAGIDVDVCYTSVLQRATHTAWNCLDAMDRTWLPTERSWRMNERHYGALHGLSKPDMVERFGAEQVRLWRRGYATRPPAASGPETEAFRRDPRYRDVPVPVSESLQDTVERVLPLWQQAMRPALDEGQRLLVVAHGTSLRALLKILCGLSDAAITGIEIGNGVPIVLDVGREGHATCPRSLLVR